MAEMLISLITGLAVGAVFGMTGAAVPAPPTIAGVLGIVGITLGFAAMTIIKAR